MPVFRITAIVLLIVLIGLVLYRNKQELDHKTRLAELKVTEWPVIWAEVKRSVRADSVEAHGIVQPAQVIKVIPKSQGQIAQIFKVAGDDVRRGEVIAKIEDTTLMTELELSKATLAQAQTELRRAQNLSAGDAVSTQQLEQARLRVTSEEARLKMIEEKLANTNVKSPINGKIAEFYYEEGSVIAQSPLCEVIDQSRLHLEVDLPEKDIKGLEKGQKVDIWIDVDNDIPFRGEIKSIGLKAGPSLRFPVKIELNNDEKASLKSGMFATFRFAKTARESIWIPRNAVLGSFSDPHVFIATNDTARLREISAARWSGDYFEVTGGLEVGEHLIISGQTNLQDGVRLRNMDK